MEERLPPVHPGEVLLEDFMKPLGIEPIPGGERHRRADVATAELYADSALSQRIRRCG